MYKLKKNNILIFLAALFIITFLSTGFGYLQNFNNNISQKKLTTSDGTKIAINEFKTGHKDVLIIAPGWFMCKDSKPFEQMAKDFSKDFDVITMDFRGHCESSGRFTFTSKEYDDLNTVIKYARKRYKKIYVAGFSLGSATAVITEYKYKNADKLILVSPPTDFDEIENQLWKKEAFIPTFKKFELKTWTHIIPGELWLEKLKPIDIINQISPTPILIIAGRKDPTIRLWHAKKLYNTAKEPKDLVIYQDSIHAEDIYLQDKKRFIELCTNWLKK